MNNSRNLAHIVEEIDYLRAERGMLLNQGPQFLVLHGFHKPGSVCLPGETVERAFLLRDGKRYPVDLSPSGLIVFDCLCKHRLKPLTATRIAALLSSDPFYVRYGANLGPNRPPVIIPGRSSIKVYLQRIREQMAKVFLLAGVEIDPSTVLSKESTEKNSVFFILRASATCEHHTVF